MLGTVYNAVNLVADFMSFTVAALEGNGPDMADEIGDMATDVVGMVPLVGGVLASEIYHLRVPSAAPSKVTGPEVAGTWTITSMTADLLDGSGPTPQPVTGTIAVAKAGSTYTVTTTGTNTDTGESVTQPLGTLTEAASGTYTGALSTDQINATAQLLQSKYSDAYSALGATNIVVGNFVDTSTATLAVSADGQTITVTTPTSVSYTVTYTYNGTTYVKNFGENEVYAYTATKATDTPVADVPVAGTPVVNAADSRTGVDPRQPRLSPLSPLPLMQVAANRWQ